jgi:hypothetical protein
MSTQYEFVDELIQDYMSPLEMQINNIDQEINNMREENNNTREENNNIRDEINNLSDKCFIIKKDTVILKDEIDELGAITIGLKNSDQQIYTNLKGYIDNSNEDMNSLLRNEITGLKKEILYLKTDGNIRNNKIRSLKKEHIALHDSHVQTFVFTTLFVVFGFLFLLSVCNKVNINYKEDIKETTMYIENLAIRFNTAKIQLNYALNEITYLDELFDSYHKTILYELDHLHNVSSFESFKDNLKRTLV